MGRRPRRKAQDTRAEILGTAEQLFRDQGITGCSIAHIAKALSMSPANVFKHFHSKITLVDAICEQKINGMIGRIQSFDTDAPAPERLRITAHRLMQTHIDLLHDSPYMFEMIFVLSEADLQSGHRYKDMLDGLFLATVVHGRDAGVYHCADPVKTSRAVCSAFVSVLHPVFLAHTPRADLDQRCDEIVDLVNAALQNPLVK